MKAQIFLSCGQNEKYGEKELAEAIQKRINDDKELGFECYLACEVQDLRDLRDVIFKRLEESDYFVFVDFKREELKKDQNGKSIHRGSLFTNQELAVASYIGLGDCVLLLQEEGVERGGVLNAVLANLKEKETRFPSSNRSINALPEHICKLIQAKLAENKWSNITRNQLALSLSRGKDEPRQMYHIKVQNHHHRKAALNCFAYLDKVLHDEKQIEIPTAEYKWALTRLPGVRIGPHSFRNFDAIWFDKAAQPVEIHFGICPSTDYYPLSLNPGKYHLTFSVVSENFAPAKRDFVLEFGTTANSVKFTAV